MKWVVAADHGGFELKNEIAVFLRGLGHEVDDLGVHSAESVDYPDIARQAASHFFAKGCDFGILCCGTGIGISIAANKIPGIRCALIHDAFTAEMSKSHNQANFLAFGGRIAYPDPVPRMLEIFLKTEFAGSRHERRVGKLAELDEPRKRT